jgi:hypothetical protein
MMVENWLAPIGGMGETLDFTFALPKLYVMVVD